MRIGLLLVPVLVLGACAGSNDDGASWDQTVTDFVSAICPPANTCSPGDHAACEQDVRTDLDQARSMLDAAGQERCIHCLQVKTDLVGDIVAQSCQSTPDQDQQVFDACDLDPSVDYDGDGTANNDDDEACAGFP